MKAYTKVLISRHRRIDKHERDIQFFDPENADMWIANAKDAAVISNVSYEDLLEGIVEQLRKADRNK